MDFNEAYELAKKRAVKTYFYCSTCGNVIGEGLYQNDDYEQANEHKCKYCGGQMVDTGKEFGDIFENYEKRVALDKKYCHIEMDEEVRLEFVYDNPTYDTEKQKTYQPLWEQERKELVYEQNNAVYGTSLLKNKPKCPTCGSTNVAPIGGLERGASVALLGLFSKKINKSFKCGHCGYTW